MNYMDLIDQKDDFVAAVKMQLNQKSFSEVADMKKNLATDLIIPTEDDE